MVIEEAPVSLLTSLYCFRGVRFHAFSPDVLVGSGLMVSWSKTRPRYSEFLSVRLRISDSSKEE